MPTTTKTELLATKIDVPGPQRADLVALLNQGLADTFDLYAAVKQAHWNVKGPGFYAHHLLFDAVAEAILPFVDKLAERATTLGGLAVGTVREAAKASRVKPYPTDLTDGQEHLKQVRDRLAAYCGNVRSAIAEAEGSQDPTTVDLFTELSRVADLQLYFVESHLQG